MKRLKRRRKRRKEAALSSRGLRKQPEDIYFQARDPDEMESSSSNRSSASTLSTFGGRSEASSLLGTKISAKDSSLAYSEETSFVSDLSSSIGNEAPVRLLQSLTAKKNEVHLSDERDTTNEIMSTSSASTMNDFYFAQDSASISDRPYIFIDSSSPEDKFQNDSPLFDDNVSPNFGSSVRGKLVLDGDKKLSTGSTESSSSSSSSSSGSSESNHSILITGGSLADEEDKGVFTSGDEDSFCYVGQRRFFQDSEHDDGGSVSSLSFDCEPNELTSMEPTKDIGISMRRSQRFTKALDNLKRRRRQRAALAQSSLLSGVFVSDDNEEGECLQVDKKTSRHPAAPCRPYMSDVVDDGHFVWPKVTPSKDKSQILASMETPLSVTGASSLSSRGTPDQVKGVSPWSDKPQKHFSVVRVLMQDEGSSEIHEASDEGFSKLHFDENRPPPVTVFESPSIKRVVSLKTGEASWSPFTTLSHSSTALDARATTEDIAAQLGVSDLAIPVLTHYRRIVSNVASVDNAEDTFPMLHVTRSITIRHYEKYVFQSLGNLACRVMKQRRERQCAL